MKKLLGTAIAVVFGLAILAGSIALLALSTKSVYRIIGCAGIIFPFLWWLIDAYKAAAEKYLIPKVFSALKHECRDLIGIKGFVQSGFFRLMTKSVIKKLQKEKSIESFPITLTRDSALAYRLTVSGRRKLDLKKSKQKC